MTDDTPRCSRRDALSAGGALAATLSSSTAGCLSLLPPVGQDVRYGRVDMPTQVDAEPRYRRWLPAQAELPEAHQELTISDMHWQSVTPGNLGGDELGANFGIGRAVVMAAMDYVGHDFQHYDHVHGFQSLGVVAEGDIDTAVVTETLLDGGYSRDGTYHDWELFDRTDRSRAVAVSESAVVSSYGDSRRASIETLLDAGDGRIERYHETDESFATYTERLGTYPEILEGFGERVAPTEPEHAGMGYTFDDESAYFVYHQQYADGETPSQSELETLLEEEHERAVKAWAVDIQIDDPHVEIQMRLTKDEFADSGTDDVRPHVMWGVEDEGETVTIRLEAGDSIPVDQLTLEPDGVLVEELKPGTVLEPGDEFRLDVSAFPESDDEFVIRYNYAGTEHDTAVIFEYTPDDLDTE